MDMHDGLFCASVIFVPPSSSDFVIYTCQKLYSCGNSGDHACRLYSWCALTTLNIVPVLHVFLIEHAWTVPLMHPRKIATVYSFLIAFSF